MRRVKMATRNHEPVEVVVDERRVLHFKSKCAFRAILKVTEASGDESLGAVWDFLHRQAADQATLEALDAWADDEVAPLDLETAVELVNVLVEEYGGNPTGSSADSSGSPVTTGLSSTDDAPSPVLTRSS